MQNLTNFQSLFIKTQFRNGNLTFFESTINFKIIKMKKFKVIIIIIVFIRTIRVFS